MVAEIIAVGTEILLGEITNTNAKYIAKELADQGVSLYYQTVVGDNPERLKESLELAFRRSDLVITTGGLGPTKDDLTKEVGASFFGKEMIMDNLALKWIEDFFLKMNRVISENNKKQALIPTGAKALYNENGTAPGILLEEDNKTLIMLPGPPKEMGPMFNKYVKPFLGDMTKQVLVSKTLRICGIGEGHMEEEIMDIIENQSNPTIAPYAKGGEVTLRITASSKTEKEAEVLIEPVKKMIYERLGSYIYGEDNQGLEDVVGQMLVDKRLTVATAESCTGGMVAETLINYPGISKAFKEGFITYSNEAKIKYLGVGEETLMEYGAVSEETALEMVKGLQKQTGVDVGISVTGIAGPGGGTSEKPVGLVYIGIAIKERVKVFKINTVGTRQYNRRRATKFAINQLRLMLNEG